MARIPGPIPKPQAELARDRSRKGGEVKEVTVGERRPVTWNLEPDPDWHPIAIRLYESVRTSGQADFYQDSDWAMLYSLCDDLSYYKTPREWTDKDTGELRQQNRYDVRQFIDKLKSEKAAPLSALTGGIHLHHLLCPDEDAFLRTRSALDEAGLLLREKD